MLSRLTTAGRYTISAAHRSANSITVEWDDGVSARYPFKWLVDHAPASPFFNPATLQREVDTFQIPFNIQPLSVQITNECQQISVEWNAAAFLPAATAAAAAAPPASDQAQGQSSSSSSSSVHYSTNWLRERRMLQSQDKNDGNGSTSNNEDVPPAAFTAPEVWHADLFLRNGGADAPTVPFEDVVSTDNDNDGLQRLLAYLVKYGLACVSGTPGTMAETERLARRIGFVEETLYGKMWATAPHLTPDDPTQAYCSTTTTLRQEAAALQQPQQREGEAEEQEAASSVETYLDTAYSNVELHLHTDGCYYTNPPGLQIFNCAYNTAAGGASRYVDGFAVAALLQQTDPDALAFLAEVALPYHCFDSEVHQLAWGPVFDFKRRGTRLKCSSDDNNQLALQLSSIRHNDYDRAALSRGMSASEVEQFYQHHETLTALIRDPSNVLLLPQHEGNTMICNNHRVLHGRDAFEGARNLMGCYIGKDEWESKARLLRVLQADAL
eukprot:gene20947-10151_t